MQFEQVKQFIYEKLKRELPGNLIYHSLGHVRDVYAAAENLARLENVTGEDLTLLLTAVLFHDAGFIVRHTENEVIACDIVRQYLPGYGYTTEQIEHICGMIMATCIPQTPHNKLEELICDADLDYLGRDDFFTLGNGHYDELRMFGAISSENEWNKLQVRFLEAHHYFTDAAIKLRRAKKNENLALVKAKITSND